MSGITIEDVIESAKKSYIEYFIPVRFFKVNNDYMLDEKNEYVCIEVFFNKYKGLLFKVLPIETWIGRINTLNKNHDGTEYRLDSIVNAKNIIDEVDFNIWQSLWKTKFNKKRELTEEEREDIVMSYFNQPVYVVLEGDICGSYVHNEVYPVFATKNVYHKRHERMRFFFSINNCKYCEYYRKTKYSKECVNVISNHYGDLDEEIKECIDFKELEE